MFKHSILSKILGVVISIVVIGFSVILYTVIVHEEKGLIGEKKRASELLSQLIIHDINTDMLDERADMVRHLIEDMKASKNTERVQIIRSNNTEEAFQDLKTIRAVEKEYGEPRPEWLANHPEKEHNIALGINDPRFQEAVKLFNQGKKDAIYYYEEYGGKRFLTYLVPIEEKPRCHSCHTTREEARGILMISTSLEEMYAMLESSRNYWMVFVFFTVLGVIFMVSFMVKSIVEPIRRVSSAAMDIAAGRYNISIPVKSSDEIGRLSDSFNKMAHEIEVRTKELQKLSMAIEQSINAVFITDRNGTVEYVNTMFEQITGYSKEEMIGRNLQTFASEMMAKDEYAELWKTISAGNTWQGSYKHKKKEGQTYWCNCLISPIKDEKENITHFLLIQEDITKKKESEARIQHLASYDELTGLYNRVRFMELMNKWIQGAQGGSKASAILLIDIDEFKSMNEIYGHNIGDEFLRHTAGLLKNSAEDVHRESVLTHLGGDEFAVFITDINEKDAMDIAEVMRKRIEGLYFAPLTTRFTASIGIALYPEHGAAVRDLLSRADIAMYRAKASGRNRCHLYQPEDHDLEKIHSRLREKERIQNCIKDGCFEPWFQPILDLKDNKIHHCEALARMHGEDGTILLPGAFIDTAEIFGLVGAIDRIIIGKTMRLQAAMSRQGRYLSFSMNLSGKDLGDEDILSFLRDKIVETGADPGRLIFEITETAAIHDMDKAVKFIKALKSIGCHFSLDDFGVGFTSFIYLREMGVDYVKIDGSFIKRLHEDNNNDRLFVKAIVDVAKGMGIKTVAEFVENEKIIQFLKQLGVDYAQGYAIGKPAPWKEIKLER